MALSCCPCVCPSMYLNLLSVMYLRQTLLPIHHQLLTSTWSCHTCSLEPIHLSHLLPKWSSPLTHNAWSDMHCASRYKVIWYPGGGQRLGANECLDLLRPFTRLQLYGPLPQSTLLIHGARTRSTMYFHVCT